MSRPHPLPASPDPSSGPSPGSSSGTSSGPSSGWRSAPAARFAREAALEAALRQLGPRVRRGEGAAEPRARLATGLPDLDAVLGGGVPRGALFEIRGPASSGRTSLGLALLAAAIRTGGLAALVDGADALDPPSAAAAGVALPRLLWVRPPDLTAALRSTERLLEAGGLPLVLLDLATTGAAPRVPPAAWPRLVRAAAAAGTAVVVLGAGPLAGSQAAGGLELSTARARFDGRPALFAGLETMPRPLRAPTSPARPLRVRMRPGETG